MIGLTIAEACGGGHWWGVRDGDGRARALYRRHYSSEKRRGSNAHLFVGPGERLLLLTLNGDAVFLWRREAHRRDGEQGVNCAIFRNESPVRSSDLIREASALAWQVWPGRRLFTFVNADAIRSSNPGVCFIKAGWTRLQRRTKEHGLVILECYPGD